MVFFAGGIFGIYLVVSVYSRYVYRTLVTDKLSAIDEVMETGEIPARWKRSVIHRLVRSVEGTALYSVGGFLLKKRYIRRLVKLIAYVRYNPRVDRHQKQSYVLELEDILKEWVNRDTKRLLSQ